MDDEDKNEKSKRYEKVKFLGEGQFAQVYKARDTQNDGEIVAVKKIKIGNRQEASDGINRTALREIKLMQELHHPNILGLRDVFGQRSNISLVFDFMETDLEVIIKDTSLVLSRGHIKAYLLMTLRGLEYLHHNWILHRDMKPNNLLIDSHGVLKIGDFGLAKTFGSPSRVYTHQVVTRWYRAPELLFGARIYGAGVDIWATGCIVAELLLRVPFLPGDSDLDQLSRIFQVFGNPTENNWPGVTKLADYVAFKEFPIVPLNDIFTAASDELLDLLQSMLVLDPNERCSATQAMKMSYFSSKPPPTRCSLLPLPNSVTDSLKENQARPNLKRRNDADSGSLAKKLVF